MIENIWRMGIQAGILILIILVIRVYLKKYSKVYSYLLWILMLVRLLCPVFIESDWSLQPDWAWQMDFAASLAEPAEDWTAQVTAEPGKKNQAAAVTVENTRKDMQGDKEKTGSAKKLSDILHTDTKSWTILGVMKCIWGAGVFGVAVYFLLQYIKIRRQVVTAIWESGRIWRCEGIDSPFVMGVLIPKIYMPYGMPENAFQYILQHEQMHIRHKDPVIRLAGVTAVCLHWWNPLVWYGIHKMNQDMEMFCDESVMKDASIADKKIYADILLDFAMKQSGYPAVLAFGESNTEQRVAHVLKERRTKWVASVLVPVVVFVMSVTFFIVPKKALAENNTSYETVESQKMYEVCGISQNEAEAFMEGFMDAVRSDKREKVAELVDYPRVVKVDGEKIYVENSTAFLEHYDRIFTDSLKSTLYQCLDTDMQYNDSGIFLGDGEVWIAKSGDALRITSISNAEGVSVRYPMSSKGFYQ